MEVSFYIVRWNFISSSVRDRTTMFLIIYFKSDGILSNSVKGRSTMNLSDGFSSHLSSKLEIHVIIEYF